MKKDSVYHLEYIDGPIKMVPPRIESSTPSEYRLYHKKDGSTILQGAFNWEQGAMSGYEWKDIPEAWEQV